MMLLFGGGYGMIKCLESEHGPQPFDKLKEAGFHTATHLLVNIHESVVDA
jgi:hypothetical protein